MMKVGRSFWLGDERADGGKVFGDFFSKVGCLETTGSGVHEQRHKEGVAFMEMDEILVVVVSGRCKILRDVELLEIALALRNGGNDHGDDSDELLPLGLVELIKGAEDVDALII